VVVAVGGESVALAILALLCGSVSVFWILARTERKEGGESAPRYPLLSAVCTVAICWVMMGLWWMFFTSCTRGG